MSKNRDKILFFHIMGKRRSQNDWRRVGGIRQSKLGVPYVYGMKGKVMTEALYNRLKQTYGDLIWDSDKQKIGKVCCDFRD